MKKKRNLRAAAKKACFCAEALCIAASIIGMCGLEDFVEYGNLRPVWWAAAGGMMLAVLMYIENRYLEGK